MPDIRVDRERGATLLEILMESNKKAQAALDSTRSLGGKLFGPSPENAANTATEISVSALARRLGEILDDIHIELSRQHEAIGSLAPSAQQGRAVGY